MADARVPRRIDPNAPPLAAGQRIGLWTLVGTLAPIGRANGIRRPTEWLCRCACGRAMLIKDINLKNGATKSCGCQSAELTRRRFTTHGATVNRTRTNEFSIWAAMKRRCESPKDSAYPNYGGRGITVCSQWRDSFEQFLTDVGPKLTKKHSLDRIDNDRGYEPGNVRWTTRSRQMRNTRVTRMLTHGNRTMPLQDWADEVGLPAEIIRTRLRLGRSVTYALTEPVSEYRAILPYQGEHLTMNQWANRVGIQAGTISARLRMGWSIKDALTKPLRQTRNSRGPQSASPS